MSPRVTRLWLALLAAGCSEGASPLLLPAELSDGAFTEAILLLQSDEALGAPVLQAELISLPPTTAHSFEVAELERHRIRLLAYERLPPELMLGPGPLPKAQPGEGVPLPEPSAAFLSSPLTAEVGSWTRHEGPIASQLPWKLPGEAPSGTCRDASSQGWLVSELSLVQPRGLLALGPNEAVIAGQWSEPDGSTPKESLLIRITDIDSGARFETLAPPVARHSYRDVIRVGEREILAASNAGWLTRVDLDTKVYRTEPSLPGGGRWELSRGEDGVVVAFDAAEEEGQAIERTWAQLVDTTTLTVSQLDAPEALAHVFVVRRDFMIAAGDRKLYRFQDGVWTVEHVTALPITELVGAGSLFVAVLERSFILERDSTGVWTERAPEVGNFELRTGAILPPDRVLLGGTGGSILQYHQGSWCSLPRPFSRAIRVIAPFDAFGALAITFSGSVNELVGISRLSFEP